jgi:hypothetical protein
MLADLEGVDNMISQRTVLVAARAIDRMGCFVVPGAWKM